MGSIQPRMVTMVPLITYRQVGKPQTYLFDDMDNFVEIHGDCEAHEAKQVPYVTNTYAFIVNAYGQTSDVCNERTTAELQQDKACSTRRSSNSSTTTFRSTDSSSTTVTSSSSTNDSSRCSRSRDDVLRRSSLDKVKSFLKSIKAKCLKSVKAPRPKDQELHTALISTTPSWKAKSSAVRQSSSSHDSATMPDACVVETACGPSHSHLVFTAEALHVQSKQWQQAARAMAGLSRWFKV